MQLVERNYAGKKMNKYKLHLKGVLSNSGKKLEKV